KSGGAYLPPAVTPSGTPVWLVSQEKPRPARPNTDALGESLRSSLRSIIAGLTDPNVRARIEAGGGLGARGTPARAGLPAPGRPPGRPGPVRALGRRAYAGPAGAADARTGRAGRRPPAERRRPRRRGRRRQRPRTLRPRGPRRRGAARPPRQRRRRRHPHRRD